MKCGPLYLCGIVLSLSACSDQAENQVGAPAPQPNAFNYKVKALNESGRNLAFRNAIRDFNAKCERVERSAFQQDFAGAAMWVARCSDTGDYAVFVNASGYAQVARCDELAKNPGPRCRSLS